MPPFSDLRVWRLMYCCDGAKWVLFEGLCCFSCPCTRSRRFIAFRGFFMRFFFSLPAQSPFQCFLRVFCVIFLLLTRVTSISLPFVGFSCNFLFPCTRIHPRPTSATFHFPINIEQAGNNIPCPLPCLYS